MGMPELQIDLDWCLCGVRSIDVRVEDRDGGKCMIRLSCPMCLRSFVGRGLPEEATRQVEKRWNESVKDGTLFKDREQKR